MCNIGSQYFLTHVLNSQISWNNRFSDHSVHENINTSVDGVDFDIRKPIPFVRCWFSHKLNQAGLRYEVAVSVCKADIVWIHGPFFRW